MRQDGDVCEPLLAYETKNRGLFAAAYRSEPHQGSDRNDEGRRTFRRPKKISKTGLDASPSLPNSSIEQPIGCSTLNTVVVASIGG
jgi:hypothetical protein